MRLAKAFHVHGEAQARRQPSAQESGERERGFGRLKGRVGAVLAVGSCCARASVACTALSGPRLFEYDAANVIRCAYLCCCYDRARAPTGKAFRIALTDQLVAPYRALSKWARVGKRKVSAPAVGAAAVDGCVACTVEHLPVYPKPPWAGKKCQFVNGARGRGSSCGARAGLMCCEVCHATYCAECYHTRHSLVLVAESEESGGSSSDEV